MSEDQYSTILEKIKYFNEGSEDLSITISFQGLTSKERAQIYDILEKDYYDQLEFEKQSSSHGNNRQVVLIITKKKESSIDKQSIKIDDNTIQYFRKYNKLSLPVIKHQYIDYYLDCLNPYTDCREIYSKFLQDIQTHGSVSKLNIHIEEVVQNITTYLKEHSAFQTFKNATFNEEINFIKSSCYKTRCSLYLKENQNKLFISLDIRQANYNIVNYYHPELFQHLSSWEEFVQSFFNDKPIHTLRLSKHLRERIFGDTGCSKKLAYLQEYFIHKILHEMNIHRDNLMMLATDEFVLQYDFETFQNLFNRYHGNLYRVTAFRLKKLPKYDYFVKEYFNPSLEIDGEQQLLTVTHQEFKCIPLHYIMQCIKQYEGKPILEIDRKFSIDTGAVATFDECIF